MTVANSLSPAICRTRCISSCREILFSWSEHQTISLLDKDGAIKAEYYRFLNPYSIIAVKLEIQTDKNLLYYHGDA